MLLSKAERLFVQILRTAAVLTAGVALLVAAGALLFAAYAYVAPNPTANLKQDVTRYRQALDPNRLIRGLYPADSSVVRGLGQLPPDGSYQFSSATTKELYAAFNVFLDKAMRAELEGEAKFEGWLAGQNRIPFAWSSSIDSREAQDERSVAILSRSLMLDYAQRLTRRAPLLSDAHRRDVYGASLDKFIAPTGPPRAPYFIVWYFEVLQEELGKSERQLAGEQSARLALRFAIPFVLWLAAGAFGYFVVVMLVFLFISIEASTRTIAEK